MRLALINHGGGLEFLEDRLRAALPEANLQTWPAAAAIEADVAICWDPPPGVLGQMPNLRLIHSIGAGVDKLMSDPSLPDLPICRIQDDDLARAMGEYCHWATLWFHRQFDQIVQNARDRKWQRYSQRPASEVPVTVLGLGAIGRHVAQRLRDSGYPVAGWSRRPHDLSGIETFCGADGLVPALSEALVVICLLPLTPQTNGILNAALFNQMRPGCGLILCGRGAHLDRGDMLTALRSGQLGGAVLDVFDQEPLDPTDVLWSEPGVLVTPHMSALTKPRRIAEQIAANVRRLGQNQPLLNLVDNASGY